MTKIYFDVNVWSNLARKSCNIDGLSRKCMDREISLYISPGTINELCLANTDIINSVIEVMKMLKMFPVLRDANEIEVDEILSEIKHSCPDISLANSSKAGIYGDGESLADQDYFLLSEKGGGFVEEEARIKIRRNKAINRYWQSSFKHNNVLEELSPDKINDEEAMKRILSVSESMRKIEKLSTEEIKQETRIVNQQPLNPMVKNFRDADLKEKERIILKYCLSHIMNEYFLPVLRANKYNSKKVIKFWDILGESKEINEDFINCIVEAIDYKQIPSLFIPIAVNLFEELQKIQESNIFDQSHAIYLRDMDHFFTCDRNLHNILNDEFFHKYLDLINSNCEIHFIDPNRMSEGLIVSRLEIR